MKIFPPPVCDMIDKPGEALRKLKKKMKYFFVLLFLLGKTFSFSQDSSGIQKLEAQFREAYYHQFNANENFFNRLQRASMYVFNIENNVFYEEVGLRKRQNKTYSVESIAGSIFDSVVLWFTSNHLWEHAPYALSKYKSFLILYNDRLCPCMTAKLKTVDYELNESDLANCVSSINTDTAYVNTLRREMQTSSMAESKFISQLSSMYVFQNCPALYEYFVDLPRDAVTASARFRNNWYLRVVDKKISDLYISKSFAKLQDIFPGYKDHVQHINSVKGIFDKKEFYTLYDERTVSPGKTEVTKTFYGRVNKKTEVYGQVVYLADEESINPILLSFQFVTPDKIKNLKSILKKIEEQESIVPPEVKELQDVKINGIAVDSLQKKKKN